MVFERERVVAAALADVGVPYLWGGNEPKDGGLDCSGAVLRWLNSVRTPPLPDMTAEMLRQRLPIALYPKVGDVAFYGKGGKASHVVLLLSAGGQSIVGANGGGKPLAKEKPPDYMARMARTYASVRIEDHRKGGMYYRSDLLDVRSTFP